MTTIKKPAGWFTTKMHQVLLTAEKINLLPTPKNANDEPNPIEKLSWSEIRGLTHTQATVLSALRKAHLFTPLYTNIHRGVSGFNQQEAVNLTILQANNLISLYQNNVLYQPGNILQGFTWREAIALTESQASNLHLLGREFRGNFFSGFYSDSFKVTWQELIDFSEQQIQQSLVLAQTINRDHAKELLYFTWQDLLRFTPTDISLIHTCYTNLINFDYSANIPLINRQRPYAIDENLLSLKHLFNDNGRVLLKNTSLTVEQYFQVPLLERESFIMNLLSQAHAKEMEKTLSALFFIKLPKEIIVTSALMSSSFTLSKNANDKALITTLKKFDAYDLIVESRPCATSVTTSTSQNAAIERQSAPVLDMARQDISDFEQLCGRSG